MSGLKDATVLALTLAIGFAACDGPTMPDPSPPQINAGASGPRSSGAPIIDRQVLDITGVFPCTLLGYDFDALQHIDARIDSQNWVNDDGSTRSRTHAQATITFTNLVTGLMLTNDVVFNEEVLVSADGLLVEVSTSGVSINVRREARGRQLVYEIGHATLTVDFSTMPPTIDATFNGRADDPYGHPCAALADPA